MAVKISALTALTLPSADDLVVIVDDPAGTPVTKKMTYANLLKVPSGTFIELLTDGATGGIKLGASGDVILYRSAANILTTDDGLTVGGSAATRGLLQVNGTDGTKELFGLESADANATIVLVTAGASGNAARIRGTTSGTDVILSFFTGGAERLRITADGDVGVGATDPGNNRLSVSQTGNGNNIAYFTTVATAPTVDLFRIDCQGVTPGAGFSLFKILGGGSIIPFYVGGDNNVGVGTTSPGVGGDSAGTVALQVGSSGTNSINIQSGAGAADQARLFFSENGVWKYRLRYANDANNFALSTTDSDGGGTDADVLRIPDGQLSVDGNTTFDDNAFDYACETCGKHSEAPFECHGVQAPWHDDVALMDEVVHTMRGPNKDAVRRLERLGVVNTYGTLDSEKPELFTSMNKMPWFLMSGMAQMYRRLAALEARFGAAHS